MKIVATAGACLLASLTAFSINARADRDKVALTDVPAAVLDAVKVRYPKAEIKSAEKETDRGRTYYEIESRLNGRELEVTLEPNGTIVEIEKDVAAGDLPKPVADAVAANHPDARIKKAQEVIKLKSGKEMKHFDVDLEVGGKDLDMKVAPDGKIIRIKND